MKVDIGCGNGKRKDFIGVDFIEQEGVDYVLDVRSGLPFANGEVEEIFTSHFLEHITHEECQALLKECYRVLKESGTMEIIVPDFAWCLEAFLKDKTSEKWGYSLSRILGQRTNSGEIHKNGFDVERLTGVLVEAGFAVHAVVPIWTHSQRSLLAKAVKEDA